jgi:hypothetical protein
MKLAIAGVEPKDKPLVFSLEYDGKDVNILANGKLIAYFEIVKEKVSLTTVYLEENQREFFNVEFPGKKMVWR